MIGYLSGFFFVFLFKMLLTPSAFHWGTTLQSVVSPERVEWVVRCLSWPWNWLVPSPTFEQIVETQKSFDQPLPLAVSGWEAWALFLMMAIACYAILPRVLLFVLQWIRLKYTLATHPFAELRFENLIRGMAKSVGLQNDPPSDREIHQITYEVSESTITETPPSHHRRCLWIADASQVNAVGIEHFEAAILKHFDLSPSAPRANLLLDGNALSSDAFQVKVEQQLAAWDAPLNFEDRILCIVDQGQQPKNAFKTRVEKIREASGPAVGIVFCLLRQDDHDSEAFAESFRIWNRMTQKWGDPNLEVEALPIKGDRL